MSKYEPLWDYISRMEQEKLTLTYEEVAEILGFPLDHSFLGAKKELLSYGWSVGRISMKNEMVEFIRRSETK